MYHNTSSLPSFRSISKDEDSSKIDTWTVWAIGVGSAMGGVFFGWEFVLYGGFISGLFAVIYTAIFYHFYAQIITELSVRYQTSGGSFDFVMDALGIRPAIVVAIMNIMKLICANAATALAISSYLTSGGMPSQYKVLVWIGIYGFFTTLDCIGIKQSSMAQVLATILCVSIVIFYVGSNLTQFNPSNILQIPKGTSKLSTIYLFFKGLPFALQFFDGFEELPLLFSYTKNAEQVMPAAISACYSTILLIALGVLISAAASANIDDLLDSEAPLMVGMEQVYGAGSFISNAMAYLIVVGLLVNFFAFVVFISQQLQAIAEANLLPRTLAYREVTYGAPIVASITGMILGLLVTAFFDVILGSEEAQNTLLMASLLPSMICYLLVLQCIVKIRHLEQKGIRYFNNFTAREQRALGHTPGKQFYVQSAIYRARISQFMVMSLLVALLMLAAKSFDYIYGLLVIAVVAVLLYLLMAHKARFDIRDERKTIAREQQQLESLIIQKRQQSSNGSYVTGGIGRIVLEGHDVTAVSIATTRSQSSESVGSLLDNEALPGISDVGGQFIDLDKHRGMRCNEEADNDPEGEENTPFLAQSRVEQDSLKDDAEENSLFGWILNTSGDTRHSYQPIR